MQAPRLIFHPVQADCVVDTTNLVTRLHELGLLGEPRDAAEAQSFFAGERFLELLTFLGCSPVIALSPEEGEGYCYIDIETYDKARLVSGSQSFQPRCKQCRAAIPDWESRYAPRDDMLRASLTCPQCGETSPLSALNWKHAAGIARQMIVIHNIYLHEAVPGDKLLQSLESLTPGSSWNYFYAL